MEHRHRPGPLKQHNKPFKSGRHASKGELKRQDKGFLFFFFFHLPSADEIDRSKIERPLPDLQFLHILEYEGKVSKPVSRSRPGLKKAPTNTRENRKKLQHIKSLQKKQEVLHSKRLGTSAGPPKIIVRPMKFASNFDLALELI